MLTDGIVSFTGNGKIVYCNNEFSELLGYSVPFLINKNVEDLIKELSVRNLLNFPPDQTQTLTLLRSDKTPLVVKARLDNIKNGFSKIFLLRVNSLSHEEGIENPANFNNPLAGEINMLFSVDVTGKVISYNEKFFETNEIPISELTLKRLAELLLDFILESQNKILEKIFPEKLSWSFLIDNGKNNPVIDCIVLQRVKNSGEIETFDIILKGMVTPPVIVAKQSEKSIVPDCHAIFDELNEPVAVITREGKVLYANEAFKTRVFNTRQSEDLNKYCTFRGIDSLDFVTPQDFIKRKINEKCEIIVRFETPDGGKNHFTGNLKLLALNDEKLMLLSISVPIESEQILNLSHQLFPGSSISGLRQRNILLNNLINRIPQGIILFKTGSETIECNISALRLFDYFNLTGRFSGHEDDPYYEITEKNHNVFEKLGLYGEKMPKSELYKEIEIITLKGNKKIVAATVLPVNGEYGEEIVKCLILTTLENAKDFLPEAEFGFASLPFAFFNIDSEGKLTTVNKYFYEVFNQYSYRDIGNLTAFDLFEAGVTSELLEDALQSDQFPVTIHSASLRINRGERIDIHILRKEDAGFSESGAFTIIIVPCNGERSQKDRLREIEKLNDVNLVRSGILKIITFKLRETLIGLIGVRDSDEFTGISRMILSESIEKLISNLKIIEVANSIHDKVFIPKSEEADLIEICSETAEQFKESAVKKHLNLNFVAYEDQLKTETDSYLLRGIVFFILENAIKFTEYGSILIEVKKLQPVSGFSALISVTDTGYGISEESKASIFFRYKEINKGLNKDYEGLGMGLFIAKLFADALGYKINVESVLGKGSKFSIFVR